MSGLPPELAARHLGARPITLDPPKTFHIPHWGRMTDLQRIAFLRDVATRHGRDPRLRELAFRILAGVDQRQYEEQAATLLRWVQQNIAYLNEPGEIIQSPLYTLEVRAGDCDDLAVLLASFYEAIGLSWRFVLSTQAGGKARRWIEGTPMKERGVWQHIYLQVGTPPFRPDRWQFVEPTVKTAKLGWDVVAGTGKVNLPEMASRALSGFALTRPLGESPAWLRIDWQAVTASVVVSVIATVLGTLILDGIKSLRRKKRS